MSTERYVIRARLSVTATDNPALYALLTRVPGANNRARLTLRLLADGARLQIGGDLGSITELDRAQVLSISELLRTASLEPEFGQPAPDEPVIVVLLHHTVDALVWAPHLPIVLAGLSVLRRRLMLLDLSELAASATLAALGMSGPDVEAARTGLGISQTVGLPSARPLAAQSRGAPVPAQPQSLAPPRSPDGEGLRPNPADADTLLGFFQR